MLCKYVACHKKDHRCNTGPGVISLLLMTASQTCEFYFLPHYYIILSAYSHLLHCSGYALPFFPPSVPLDQEIDVCLFLGEESPSYLSRTSTNIFKICKCLLWFNCDSICRWVFLCSVNKETSKNLHLFIFSPHWKKSFFKRQIMNFQNTVHYLKDGLLQEIKTLSPLKMMTKILGFTGCCREWLYHFIVQNKTKQTWSGSSKNSCSLAEEGSSACSLPRKL